MSLLSPFDRDFDLDLLRDERQSRSIETTKLVLPLAVPALLTRLANGIIPGRPSYPSLICNSATYRKATIERPHSARKRSSGDSAHPQ